MAEKGSGRRRYARLTLKEPMRDPRSEQHEVRILELSLGGARVEHTTILRPGGAHRLHLPLGSRPVAIQCFVVWSEAKGRAKGEPRGMPLRFYSGLEFRNLTPEVQALLTAYLQAEGLPISDAGDPR